MLDINTDDELPADEAKVFLSYSRKDRENAQRIADVLRERHYGVFKDTDDILPTEEWQGRLQQLIEEADTATIPPLLAKLNFIFCTERNRFQDAVDTLVSALSVDIDWIREHTRLAGLARRRSDANRPSRLLMRGRDIVDAESWRDGHPGDAPVVTAAQAALISDESARFRTASTLLGTRFVGSGLAD